MHPNFSGTNMINLFKNVSIRYIIALGISGCLITTGNDLSAGRLLVLQHVWPASLQRQKALPASSTPNMPTTLSHPRGVHSGHCHLRHRGSAMVWWSAT